MQEAMRTKGKFQQFEPGFVYIARFSLYAIIYQGRSHFAFDEMEKASILKKLKGKALLMQRSKGLGENETDMMWEPR